jgi:hypothetical protein
VSVVERRAARREALAGVVAGLLLAFGAWLSTGRLTDMLTGHVPASTLAAARQNGGVAALLPTMTPTPAPPADCQAPAALIAQVGFDPYRILARERPDVLRYYAANGWDVGTRCTAIYDDWAAQGAGGKTPTTPAAYVIAQGWAPKTRLPTPTPLPSCVGPADETAKLGFDPYAILAVNRPDVLTTYAANGWKPASQCVAIFDNWLKHPDGGPAMTAAQFVESKGWARAPAATPTPSPRPEASPTAVAMRSSAIIQTETTSQRSSATSAAATYVVQPGDTLSAIAQRFHTSQAALLQANDIADPNQIAVGQVLRLPAATPTP